jgi:anaerobic magnesium-protoporphyrin IX monomethyl ester cyclase
MKVLLINPPRQSEIIGNNPKMIEERRGHNPPLGLLYLAGYLERHASHQVKILDAQVEELSYEALAGRLRQEQADVVGITAMTLTLLDVMKTVSLAKAARPETTVVLGGPHVHLFPEETIRLPGVDALVLGEGEVALAELLEHWGDWSALSSIPGLVFRHNGSVTSTPPRPPLEDLDSIPFPARHLTPYTKYNSLLGAGEVVTTIFTSRGCPFRCSFCDRPHLGKRFRARSAENVVDEIETCVRLGIREFLFYDDTFTINRRRVRQICELIGRRGLKISFDIRTRVDTVNDEMLGQLKKAGCRGIHYGVEAGSPRVLEILNKEITIEKAKATFALTRRHGIPILAYFMIGNPSETREEIRTTFRVIRELNPDFVHVTVLTPFPGTQVYREALQRGIIPRDVWREFSERPSADFEAPHWGENFTKEELLRMLTEGYKSFYLRPSYIGRRLWRLRSWTEFKKKARAGLSVLGMK